MGAHCLFNSQNWGLMKKSNNQWWKTWVGLGCLFLVFSLAAFVLWGTGTWSNSIGQSAKNFLTYALPFTLLAFGTVSMVYHAYGKPSCRYDSFTTVDSDSASACSRIGDSDSESVWNDSDYESGDTMLSFPLVGDPDRELYIQRGNGDDDLSRTSAVSTQSELTPDLEPDRVSFEVPVE